MLDPSQYSELMGALGESKDEYVCVFVPSMTRDGIALDHPRWREEAVRVMSVLFGGATSVSAFGGWLDDEGDGEVKEEGVSLVVSFVSAEELNRENVLVLKDFLHRMGRETNQGEIGVHLKGRFLRIRRFSDG